MLLNRACRPCVVLLLTLTLIGCGKSESTSETKTAPLKASAQPAAQAPSAEKPAVAPVTATPAAAASKAPEVKRLKLPADVVAALALRSLDGVLNSAKATLELLDPANAQPGFISAIKEGIKESLGWKNISWIRSGQPIRLLVFNAKQYEGKAQFLVLPMTSKDAVLAALPDGARQKEGDHVAKYDNNGQTVFVDFVEGHAVYTDHESFFAKGKPFYEAQLRGWLPSREIEVKLDLDNVYGLFLPELSEAKRQLIDSYSRGSADGPTGLDRVLAFEVESLFALFESSHQADLNIWVDGRTFNLSAAFLPKAETGLDTFRKTNADKRSTFAKWVPKTGMFNSVMNIEFGKHEGMMKAIDLVTMDAYKEIADLRPEDIATIEAQLKLMANQAMGDAMISVYADGEFPGALAAVAKFREPLKVKAAYGTIFNTVFPRVIAKLKKEGGADVPAQLANAKSISALVPLVNELGGPLGIKLATFEESAEDVSLSGVKVNMDWARFAAATEFDKTDPELFTILKGVLGDQFAAVIGASAKGQKGSITFGPKAAEAGKALLTGAAFGGGESGIVRAAPDNIGAVSIRMETMLKALSFIPALASKIELLKKVPAERPLVATLNADATKVDLHLSIPVDVLQVLGEIQK